VFGVRTPRPRVGQCVYERLRGRQSRAALRRILSRGDIHIAPTGQLNQLGDKMARVSVDGQSVARRLVAARVAIVRRPGQNYNPWCLSLRRPPV
jgi:endonuclease YncB( thermonuclease family)